MAVRTVPAAVPAGAGADLLLQRELALRPAARLGLVGGLVAVFVSAIGMVETFSERDLIGDLSLGTILLVSIPLLMGYLAGRPPPRLEGFAAPSPGGRNVAAGLLAGLVTGVVMSGFVLLINNFDVRDIFLNISPALVREDPRLLTFGLDVVPGVGLILVIYAAAGGIGSALHLLSGRSRRVVLAGVFAVLAFALLAPFLQQVLRGIQDQLNILTSPLDDILYEPRGALTVPGALLVGFGAIGLYSWLTRSNRTPIRARVERFPDRRRRLVYLAAVAVVLIVLGMLPQILGTFLSGVLNTAGIFLMMALGLNIVVGFAGLLDLGYVAFFAVGAYTTALLTSPSSSLEAGWVFWAAIPFVLLAAAVAGLLVGAPVLRMRGDYLAIVTLGFGEIARLLFLSDWLKPIFGGAQGITRIPNITIGPIEISGEQAFLYAVFIFVLVAAYVSYSLQDSRMGRAWMAMREDESVAEAIGVNIVSAKLSAFVIGAVLAGVGGALFGTKVGSVFPHSFDITVSITVLVVIIVGGMASLPGVVLGAFVLVAMPELLREFEEYRFLIYGALLILMMLKRPEGFIPSKRRATELHEEEVMQDAWLEARAATESEKS